MSPSRRLCALLAVIVLQGLAPSSFALAEDKAKTPEHAGSSQSFLHVPGLTSNLPSNGGRPAVVTLEAGLDVPDPVLRKRAEQSIPRLRDAYRRMLQTVLATTPPGGQPDLDRVSSALQTATDKVLGKPGARFLIGTVVVN